MKLVLNQNFCEFSRVFWLGPRSAFKRKEISIRQAYKQYDSKCIYEKYTQYLWTENTYVAV